MKNSLTTTCSRLPRTLLGLLALSGLAVADTLSVSWNGTKDYTSIQDAVDDAQPGDVISVYPGTYTGSGTEVVYIDVEDLTIEGNGASIDGQGVRRCIRVVGVAPGPGVTINLENLILENGEAVSSSGAGWKGNGGGLYAEGSVSLTNVTVRDCRSDADGGGIAIESPYGVPSGKTTLHVHDSTVESCTADGDGGGVFVEDADVYFYGSEILNCTAVGRGGGLAGFGGTTLGGSLAAALFTDSSSGSSASSVSGNHAGKSGGGIYADNLTVSLDYSEVSDNRAYAGNGGGISTRDAYLLLGAAVLIKGNIAYETPGGSKGNGGGIHAVRCRVHVSSNGATTFFGNGAHGGGGAVFAKDCLDVWLHNCLFEENVAYGKGGAVAVDSCGSLLIGDSFFLKNLGAVAGALHVKDLVPSSYGHQIHDVGMVSNVGAMAGGLNGAALVLRGSTTDVSVADCNFWQNTKKHVMVLQGANLDDQGGNTISPN